MDKIWMCDEVFACLLETIDLTMEQIETLCPGTSDAYREAIAAYMIRQTMPQTLLQ